MKIRLLGDIHGNLYSWEKHTKESEYTVQLGDFGIGFFDSQEQKRLENWFKENPKHQFIRGNHDDPELCKSMEGRGYIPDGYVQEVDGVKIFYIGGAASYDRYYRVERNILWWEDEELTFEEQVKVHDRYMEAKPDIVIAHDAPSLAIRPIMFESGRFGLHKYVPSATNRFFDSLYKKHQPHRWFFGHWHYPIEEVVSYEGNATIFRCLNINETFDLDTETILQP